MNTLDEFITHLKGLSCDEARLECLFDYFEREVSYDYASMEAISRYEAGKNALKNLVAQDENSEDEYGNPFMQKLRKQMHPL